MGDIKGVEIHDVLGISKPLIKLIDAVKGALGKLYEPTHIRRMTKAKAEEIRAISSSIANNLNLPAEYSDGSIIINSKDANDLVIRAQNRFLFQEIQKQQNIEAVVAGAYNLLEQEENVDEEPVDKDWIIRFFNSVEDVSNEDLQKLWSKILAGEIKHPKSFSMRTLDALRNISREEALLFEKVYKASCIISNSCLIINDKNFMEKHGIPYDDILRLDECGLINSSSSLALSTDIPLKGRILIRNSKILILAKSKQEEDAVVRIRSYPMSSIGSEIAQLYGDEMDSNIAIEYAKFIKNDENNNNVIISAHKYIGDIDGKVVFDPKDLLLED